MQSKTGKNLLGVYGVQFGSIVLPLILIPLMARTLGPELWGHFVTLQALALALTLVVDYGFGFSATRYIARHQDDPQAIRDCVNAVLSAKALLALLLLLIAAVIFMTMPAFQESPWGFWAAMIFAITQGSSPLWYFQGKEDVFPVAVRDISLRALATIVLVLTLKDFSNDWYYFLVFSLFNGLSYIYSTLLMLRETGRYEIKPSKIIYFLKDGAQMFIFRAFGSLYGVTNVMLLRTFASASAVGFYSNAEKSVGVSRSMLPPFTQVMFPKVASLLSKDPEKAWQALMKSYAILLLASLAMSTGLYILSDWIIALLFGNAYMASSRIMKILSIALPFVATYDVFGIQWLLSLGKDKVFTNITVFCSLVALAIACFIAAPYGARGLAYCSVFIDGLSASLMVIYALRYRRKLFSNEIDGREL
ncbi:oligosaccharide flippase family protein [Deinococcus sp. Marseille-Q6407]|uniref:oligosaccharide flippase family protein n=1 Tax=Deinococcus sp. Marseille-Q6407 TaxID=2969223 RepID=UPI0021C069FF|nr:oligosaccharide flippase family protein [Deinococcus sp. Marseille-Q6407]